VIWYVNIDRQAVKVAYRASILARSMKLCGLVSTLTASRTGTSGLQLVVDSPVVSESRPAVWLPVCGRAVSLASNRLSVDRPSMMSALAVPTPELIIDTDGVSFNTPQPFSVWFISLFASGATTATVRLRQTYNHTHNKIRTSRPIYCGSVSVP